MLEKELRWKESDDRFLRETGFYIPYTYSHAVFRLSKTGLIYGQEDLPVFIVLVTDLFLYENWVDNRWADLYVKTKEKSVIISSRKDIYHDLGLKLKNLEDCLKSLNIKKKKFLMSFGNTPYSFYSTSGFEKLKKIVKNI